MFEKILENAFESEMDYQEFYECLKPLFQLKFSGFSHEVTTTWYRNRFPLAETQAIFRG